MALPSDAVNQQTIEDAIDATYASVPDWKATMDELDAEIKHHGLSVDPQDLFAILTNVERESQYFDKLMEWCVEDLSIKEYVASGVTEGYKALAVEEINIQEEIKSSSPAAIRRVELLRKIFLQRPLEALRIVDDEHFDAEFREETKTVLDRLSRSVEGLFERIKPQRDIILQKLRDEVGLQQYVDKFNTYCELAQGKVTEVQEKYGEAEEKIEQMEGKNRSLHKRLDRLRVDNDRLRALLDTEREMHAAEVAQLNEDNESATEKLSEAETKLQSTAEQLTSANASLKQLREDAETQGRLHEERKGLIQSLDKAVESLRKAVDKADKDTEKAEKQTDALLAARDDKISTLQQSARAADEKIESLRRANQQATQDLVEKQKQLESLTAAKSELDATMSGLRKAKADADAELNEKSTRIEELRSAAARDVTSIQSLQADLNAAKLTIDQKDEEIKSLNRVKEELDSTLTDLQEEKNVADAELGRNTAKIEELQSAAARDVARIQSLEVDLNAANSTVDQKEKEIKSLDRVKEELDILLAELQKAKADADAELKEKSTEIEELRSAAARDDARIQSLENELVAADMTIDHKEDEIKAVNRAKDETAAQHLNAINQKDEEILGLRNSEQLAKADILDRDNSLAQKDQELTGLKATAEVTAQEHASKLAEKDGEITRLKESERAANAANEAHVNELTERAGEIAILKQSEQAAKEAGVKHASEIVAKDEEIRSLRTAAAQDQAELSLLRDKLVSWEQSATDASDEHARAIAEKDAEIRSLRTAAAQDQAELSLLRNKVGSLEQSATDASDEHARAIAEKDAEIQALRAAAEQAAKQADAERQGKDKKIKDLEEEVTKTASEAQANRVQKEADIKRANEELQQKNQMIKDLQKAMEEEQTKKEDEIKRFESENAAHVRHNRFAHYALSVLIADSCNTGHDQIDDRADELVRLLGESSARDSTGTHIVLPSSLRFSNTDGAEMKPLVLHILYLWYRSLTDKEHIGIRRHAQAVFDAASDPDLCIFIPCVRRTVWALVYRLGLMAESPEAARLGVIAVQGIVLLACTDIETSVLEGFVNDLSSWVDSKTSSSCLRFMMEQVGARLSRLSPSGALPWLSGYPAGANQLDATNSALPEGTRLIADESGLFFLAEANVVSVFTQDDVEKILWDYSTTADLPLTIHFEASSVMGIRSILLSVGVVTGPVFFWVDNHLISKLRFTSSLSL
ncbi:MAG: hypothetical protein LQ338_007828 [Usnochroma carphineum]|nr:MAG: hypothetical protein LQ338_007828 [Usnochroma carphineum]